MVAAIFGCLKLKHGWLIMCKQHKLAACCCEAPHPRIYACCGDPLVARPSVRTSSQFFDLLARLHDEVACDESTGFLSKLASTNLKFGTGNCKVDFLK